jgi:hypothetical protein
LAVVVLSDGRGNNFGETQMDLTTLALQLVAGALGGNVAGSVLKHISLGTLGNSLAGLLGGGLGGQILANVLGLPGLSGAEGLDIGALASQFAGGGVGGAVVMAIVGIIKNALAK